MKEENELANENGNKIKLLVLWDNGTILSEKHTAMEKR